MGYAWNIRNRERKRAYDRQYRLARWHAARRRIFERDGYRCAYCEKVYSYEQLDVDHKEPLSRGGSDDDANKITSCRSCNKRKRASTYTEYMAKLHPDREPDWVRENAVHPDERGEDEDTHGR